MTDLLALAAALLAASFAFFAARFSGAAGRVLADKIRGLRKADRRSFLRAVVLTSLARQNERWIAARHLARIDRELVKAGRPHDLRAAEIAACVELGAASFAVLGFLFVRWSGLGPGTWLAFVVFGAGSPLLWVHDKVKARHRAIGRELPYDLDLLTLAVEAGLDFAAALAKVVEKGRHGPLSIELSVTLKELKLGKTREEALRNLADRVGLLSLTNFVRALVQADRLGTPLGKVLRVLSVQMRQERTQRAEKLANEAPVKLLIPLIGCIFPTIFLMLFGPIVYQVFLGGSF
ncbi:MAG TPA: type II secretion system F family protein [Myxococcales bacterium]|jgi:tight adherence protein C